MIKSLSNSGDDNRSMRDSNEEENSRDLTPSPSGDLRNHYDHEEIGDVKTTGDTYSTEDPRGYFVLGD